VAEWRGRVAWQSGVAEWRGRVAWQSGVAEWLVKCVEMYVCIESGSYNSANSAFVPCATC
jgi:hypothetical protein